jgi:hypothetical protein
VPPQSTMTAYFHHEPSSIAKISNILRSSSIHFVYSPHDALTTHPLHLFLLSAGHGVDAGMWAAHFYRFHVYYPFLCLLELGFSLSGLLHSLASFPFCFTTI